MAALPRFAMLHIIKPQDFWNSVFRTDKGFGHAQHLIWWKPNSISARTPHSNCQTWWWRDVDWAPAVTETMDYSIG